MSDISVIGLGAMGSVIARTLLQRGYSVTVWNRTQAKSDPLVAAGAICAGSAAEAVAASPATITMISSYDQTAALLSRFADMLEGKTIIEFAAGGMADAEILANVVTTNGGSWLIGIINAYPEGVGSADTVLTMAGEKQVWETWKPVISAIGGNTTYVGTEARMIAALFAGLFTARQAFMFGMIYGGLVCRKGGIALDTYIEQLPVSLGMLPSYYKYFAETAAADFESTQATMRSYGEALDDVLGSFKTLDASADLPQLFSDLAKKGVGAGMGDKALTALIDHLDKG